MNLIPFNGSLAALFDRWFFALPASFWLLMAIMASISVASYAARSLPVAALSLPSLLGLAVRGYWASVHWRRCSSSLLLQGF